MNVSIAPIFPIRERNREERGQEGRLIDSKVRGLVLERISQTKGGLLPSAMAPKIVIDFLPALESAKLEQGQSEKRKAKLRKTPLKRKAPIGLRPVDPEGWLNALMQFILFVPGFAELFFFAPKSFYPFQEFIDQYFHDREENCTLSSANGTALFRFVRSKLSDISLNEIFQFLIRSLHPQWEIHKTIEEALESGYPTDFFITESCSRRQFFAGPDFFCYDLDAFIELRPDGSSVNFITYVKYEGGWYQCDDDRITQLRSNSLAAPLSRAILLHYLRIDLTNIRK